MENRGGVRLLDYALGILMVARLPARKVFAASLRGLAVPYPLWYDLCTKMDNQPAKLEILTFIRGQEVVWIETLCAQFGYTYWGAVSRLRRLCKEGLVETLHARGLNKGRYLLTTRGAERIVYLIENEKNKKQAEQINQLRDEEQENKVKRLSQRVMELERENEVLGKQNQQLIWDALHERR